MLNSSNFIPSKLFFLFFSFAGAIKRFKSKGVVVQTLPQSIVNFFKDEWKSMVFKKTRDDLSNSVYLSQRNFLNSALAKAKISNDGRKVEGLDEDDLTIIPAASGSGFFITNSGHIISNYHVVDSCNEVKVHFKGDEKKTKILAKDLVNDLVLLKSEIIPDEIFAIAKEDIGLLEEVYVAGFPFGKEISSSIKVTRGVVSSLSGVGDNYSNIQIDAPLQPGNSGGPIIDENGNVVGVAVAKLDFEKIIEIFGVIPEDTNFGIKSSVVKTFLKANNVALATPINKELSKKAIGQKITNATVYLDCWMTQAKINELRSRKVLFENIK